MPRRGCFSAEVRCWATEVRCWPLMVRSVEVFQSETCQSLCWPGYIRKFLQAFEDDCEYPFQPVHDTYDQRSRSDYYRTMMANVMAEAVGQFHSGGARLMSCKPAFNKLVVFQETGTSDEVPDLQLKNNVVQLYGALFWITECEVKDPVQKGRYVLHAAEVEGVSVSDGPLQSRLDAHFEAQRLKVRLFAGDYLARYRCAAQLEIELPPEPMLERMVLNPTDQVPCTYSRGAFDDSLMPINADQRRAVQGLRHRVEIIHGPPGTGKSTTIFHLLSACLPQDAAAVVTCVTNQAINAVAEKLQKAHEGGSLKILVLGNPNRVGYTAGKYTLDSLCARDALVLSMTWACKRLQKVYDKTEELQRARHRRLCKPHRRSRLSLQQIEGLPSVAKYREDLPKENLERRRQRMPEQPYDPMGFYLERINASKSKMAWAVVQDRPLKMPVRSRLGVPPRRWHVATFHERLKKCLEKVRIAHRVAVATAPRRTVRNTRVFLCTIPSSYKAGPLCHRPNSAR